MKRILSFLSVFLLALLGSTDAVAQLPAVSDGSNTYLYYIYNVRANGYFVTTTDATGGAQQLGSANATTNLKQKVTFKVVAASTSGQYNIVATNVGSDPLYVGWSATDGANTVQLYASAEGNRAWIISAYNYDGHYGVSISPSAASGQSWNMHGAAGNNIGLYGKNDGGGIWMFVPADATTYNKMLEDANTLLGYGSSHEFGKVSSTTDAYTALQTAAANTTFSDDNAKALGVAYAKYVLINNSLYLPNGYYTMTGLETTRARYLFNDYLHDGNEKGYTLASTTASTNNNYIWKITNNGTNISILNGQGTPMGVGNQGQSKTGTMTKYSTLNFAPYNNTYYTSNAGFAFIEGLDQAGTADYQLTDGTYFVTTWANNAGKAECRWQFVAAAGEAYTVTFVGTNSNISEKPYLTHTSTGQIALNNGFFMFTEAPRNEDFSFTSSYYNGNATVDAAAHTITVNITPSVSAAKTILQDLTTSVQTYYNLLGDGVGKYTSSEFATAYENAINALNGTDLTADEYFNLHSALTTAFNNLSINKPENGKAYKFIVKYAGDIEETLYWNGTRITAQIEANISDKNSEIFVARALKDGKIVFVNNAGKFLTWCDSGDATKSLDVKGYSNTYVQQCNWTIEEATNTSNQRAESLAGLYQISALNKAGNNRYYLNPRYEFTESEGVRTITDAAFISAGSLDKFYDNAGGNNGKVRSYIFQITEVEYPNNVTLNQAVGIDNGDQNIGTFSAPFATVVPEGVTAYVVYEAGNSAKMAEFATSGQAIPANTGVLLYGTATKALMVPATSETQASIADGQSNKLIGTAGAAKNMEDVAGAYILGKPADADKVAFYHCSGGTLAMNKAYLDLSTSGAAALEIDFGGEATGLTNLNIATEKASPIYDLSGRRVMNVQKGGLYIQNGKKFIVK